MVFRRTQLKCHKWVSSLPNKAEKVTEHIRVCSRHWLSDTPHIREEDNIYNLYASPINFGEIPSSSISHAHTKNSSPYQKKAVSENKVREIDELDTFIVKNNFNCDTVKEAFKKVCSSMTQCL